MAFDAFKVTEEGERSKLEVKKEVFTSEGEELSYAADDVLIKIQRLLDAMSKELKSLGLNKKESRLAHLAIERELEKSIPDAFMKAYEQAGKDWKEATMLITKNILGAVNKFMVNGEYLPEPTERLKEVEGIVDSESWTPSLNLAEIKDVLEAIDHNITSKEIADIQQAHSPFAYAKAKAEKEEAAGRAERLVGKGGMVASKAEERAAKQQRASEGRK